MHVDHPQVGGFRLNREKLSIGGTAGQMLVIYHPDPGSADADKLALLASAALPPAHASPAEPVRGSLSVVAGRIRP
jgi:transcription regulator MmyB-like protein